MAGKTKDFTEKLISRIREEQLSRLRGMELSSVERIKALFDCSIRRVYLKTSTDDDRFRKTVENDADKVRNGFRCHGSLKLAENKKLKSLPYRMVVAGDLFIRDTPLAALPEDLSVRGKLTIRGTDIKKIPKTVRVGGDAVFSRW